MPSNLNDWSRPWRWTRKTQGVFVVALFISYIFSPPIVELVLESTDPPPVVLQLSSHFYAPMNWCYARSGPVREFIQWERHVFRNAVQAMLIDETELQRTKAPAVRSESDSST